MTKQQRSVIIGSILGDGFLQRTGKKNARLRFEHSLKQKEYLVWKCQVLAELFQSKPKILKRKNPAYGKTYQYVRAQSYSDAELGEFLRLFYHDCKKVIPDNINKLLKDPLSLAVWFMDDGYYYARDKMAYIYLPKYDQTSMTSLLLALQINFNLFPSLKIKKRGEYVLIFSVKETGKLVRLIQRYLIPSMAYKSPPFDPVSTDPIKRVTDITLG